MERPDLGVPEYLRPFAVVASLVAVMWAVEIVDLVPGTELDRWGIRPRELVGLIGIATAPVLHAGFAHLMGNTVPFLILGCVIAMSGIQRYVQVTVLVGLAAGIGTWLTGTEGTIHIGASGIVFGYLTYLVARGLFERRLLYLAVSLGVVFFFGGMLWGVFPRAGISWQSHLFGALGGVAAAAVLHRADQAPANS